jgi:hypothetical protein
MNCHPRHGSNVVRPGTSPRNAALLLLAAATVVGCGGGGGGGGVAGSAEARVTLSDPPVCEAPTGPFLNVWVTVTRVRAHINPNAMGGQGGWVDLLDLTTNPVQVDLLNLGIGSCFLTQLGSTTGLPPGRYQQIRIHLLSNTPGPGEAVPMPNMCAGTGGYNCVVTAAGPVLLELSSQANTGLKVPPGRIVGGAIELVAGQAANINIDFDACRSIRLQGNGRYRLQPTLSAGELSLANPGISGRVVDAVSGMPLAGATVYVLAEMPDAEGIRRVMSQTVIGSVDGTFDLCPLPAGTYDIVVAAVDGGGIAYGPTVLFDVPSGSVTGDIPVDMEPSLPGTPALVMGLVTAAGPGGMPSLIDVELSALQLVTPPGAVFPVPVTLPALPGSSPLVTTDTQGQASYGLWVPTLDARSGVFAPGGTTYVPGGPAPVLCSVNAVARDGTTGDPTCAPSSLTVSDLEAGGPIVVMSGATVLASTIGFTGCP